MTIDWLLGLQVVFLVLLFLGALGIIILIIGLTCVYKKEKMKKDKAYYRVTIVLIVLEIIIINLFKALLSGVV